MKKELPYRKYLFCKTIFYVYSASCLGSIKVVGHCEKTLIKEFYSVLLRAQLLLKEPSWAF
jgi:hypothetical protein